MRDGLLERADRRVREIINGCCSETERALASCIVDMTVHLLEREKDRPEPSDPIRVGPLREPNEALLFANEQEQRQTLEALQKILAEDKPPPSDAARRIAEEIVDSETGPGYPERRRYLVAAIAKAITDGIDLGRREERVRAARIVQAYLTGEMRDKIVSEILGA